MAKKLLFSSFVISFGLLLGRLMGFVREVTIASTFGVSTEADVAVLVLTIPDVLVNILVAGGLSASLIPEFKSSSKEDASALFWQVSVVTSILFVLMVSLLGFIPSLLTYVFAPGLSAQAAMSAQRFLSTVLWVLPLTVLAGITKAFLQSQEKFLVPAIGTLIFNSCIVFGLFVFVRESKNLNMLVGFIILGGAVRWWSQLWVMRHDICWAGNCTRFALTKELFHRYWQAVVAVGALSLYPIVARSFASFAGEGSVAMMNYAWRLVEFPLGLVVTVLSVVLFPRLSELNVVKDSSGFVNTLRTGLTWSLLLAMTILGPVLAAPEIFVELTFGWGGNISLDEIDMIAQLLRVGIVILPFQAVIAMSVAALNARKNTRTPMIVSLIGFVLLLPLCGLLQTSFSIKGVIVAVLLCYILVGGILIHTLWRMNKDLLRFSMLATPLLAGVFSYACSHLVLSFDFSLIVSIFLLVFVMVLTIFIVGGLFYKNGIERQYAV